MSDHTELNGPVTPAIATGIDWMPDGEAGVFVVEYVRAIGSESTTGVWTTPALDPDDAVSKFRRVNWTDRINRVLFDTGWHRATEQEEYVPPAQEPVTESPIPAPTSRFTGT